LIHLAQMGDRHVLLLRRHPQTKPAQLQLPTFHHLGGLKMRPLCLLGQKMDRFDGHTFHPPILPLPYLKFTDKEFRHDFGWTLP